MYKDMKSGGDKALGNWMRENSKKHIDWTDQIMEVLLKCGSITVTNTNSKKENCFYVTFDNHVSASKLLKH